MNEKMTVLNIRMSADEKHESPTSIFIRKC